MLPHVVNADDARTDGGIERGQRQLGRSSWLPVHQIPTLDHKEFRVDSGEKPFDLATTLRACDGRMHLSDFEIRSDLLQVATGEIAAVIDVKYLG